MRFLASVVSQSFLAFGDILELNRKLVELSGGINRIFELEELLDAAHSGTRHPYFVLYANMPFKLLSSCLYRSHSLPLSSCANVFFYVQGNSLMAVLYLQ